MLEVGRTYQIPVRGGVDVDIVGQGVNQNWGQFFVGISRNDDHSGDWPAHYKPDGSRIWTSSYCVDQAHLFNIMMPERYVKLDDALSLIRSRHRLYEEEGASGSVALSEAMQDLQSLPVREMVDA